MNVLLIAQCDKRALVETRRILDQFAERRGDRTWQTPITQDGLTTLRKLLRKTARKNTAVSCHWIRGMDHSELLWIVGDAARFNSEGAVPTNFTQRNVLRAGDENNWHSLPVIHALTALAALIHDLGKATQAFQDRLSAKEIMGRNLYRHEWVSVRLLQAFVGTDDDATWLTRLAACAQDEVDSQAFESQWNGADRLLRDGLDKAAADVRNNPFHGQALPPLAQAVAWLVLTHHRLPCLPIERSKADLPDADDDQDDAVTSRYKSFGSMPSFFNGRELDGLLGRINADWNEPPQNAPESARKPYWLFPHGLPVRHATWRKQAARAARRLLDQQASSPNRSWLHDPFVSHLARLCLMLADHHYSGLSFIKSGPQAGEPHLQRKSYLQDGNRPIANTTHDANGRRVANQTLDEHLLGVHAQAGLIVHALPSLVDSLPALANHRGLKKRSADPRFQWQDKAADLAVSLRTASQAHGAFIVNMASTGCGKTLGNARIMNALAHPARGLRCAFAIGLRTLTLQTGRSFQQDLGLGDDQLAIKVGGSASKALFAHWQREAEATGSASGQKLIEEIGQVLFEGNDQHPLLQRLTDDAQARSLLAAPLLVCTVDHLMPATESLRGGAQIAPMLRLMTGDLVLDEPDDFDMADLPALTRLVHWAGLLGSRVLLSSATLPPALVAGLFLAYREGREAFNRNRSERPGEALNVCCLWVDEFQQAPAACADLSAFNDAHKAFTDKRIAQLAKADVRRRAQVVPLPQHWLAVGMNEVERRDDLALFMLDRAWQLHQKPQNHGIDPVSGKQVSFGLIRMANIDPLFDVALAMYRHGAPNPDVQMHLCVYHSQFVLLARSVIEQQLDTVLNRRPGKDGVDPIWQRPAVREAIDRFPAKHHLFIVLGSPVTEVGRDHDYDWAVVEPSSIRSIIQLAGRVRRHRPGAIGHVNIDVLDSNLRALENPAEKAAFCMPGFEMDDPHNDKDPTHPFHLRTHSLDKLLARHVPDRQNWEVDARPRVSVVKEKFDPTRQLVNLEHARMHEAMLPRAKDKPEVAVKRNASLHWHHADRPWLTGLMPQFQRFRHDDMPRVDVALLPDDDGEKLVLHRVEQGSRRGELSYVPIEESQLHHIDEKHLARVSTITSWATPDLLSALRTLAEAQDMDLKDCASKYATASLPRKEQGWRFHDVLGFTKNP